MVDPIATPNDVRSRLNLPEPGQLEGGASITNQEISTYLEDAAFDIQQAGARGLSDDLRKQLEWRLAGIMILSQRKGLRSYHQQSLGSMSRSYEVKSVQELKDWVKRHGPAGLVDEGEFWHASIQG